MKERLFNSLSPMEQSTAVLWIRGYSPTQIATLNGLSLKAVFRLLRKIHKLVVAVYCDLPPYLLPVVENNLIIASEAIWTDLIASLSRNPEQLYTLPPRRFEELVAELLCRDGMEVQLTPPTKDGGVDILAFCNTQAGRHLYLVECKRYSKENPVYVSLVRSLYGVVEAERATAGLLVTTSFFTKGALSFSESIKYRLSMKNYDDLVRWIKNSKVKRNGT